MARTRRIGQTRRRDIALEALSRQANRHGPSLADLLRRCIDEGLPGTLERLSTLDLEMEGAHES